MHCLFFRFGHWFAKCCCQLLCFSFCFLLADVPAYKPQSKIWWAHLFWRRNRQKSRDALSAVSGENDIKYKYPQNGQYRSSFIFYDIDSDGSEEALVFYQSASKGDSTWINILDRSEEGKWISVCETPAPDTTANIDFVSFEHLLDSDSVRSW